VTAPAPPVLPLSPLPLSLVVATLGRTEQVGRLLRSLASQDPAGTGAGTGFEVVVVDQNDDDRLLPVLAGWPFPVRRLHTPGERGASRARNRGWRACGGEVVLFPDDDCWYAPGFLARSLALMRGLGCDVLCGRAADETGRSINGRFEPVAQPISRANVWTTGIEWMVFFRRAVLEAVDGFDEAVGIGAASPWQSSEHQDILLRAMAAGFTCRYDPAVAGHHEEIVAGPPDARTLTKARGYARGMGHVLRVHGFPLRTRGLYVLRPVAAAALALAGGRGYMVPYYREVAIGRLEGATARLFGRG
jgi:glycosyltransferase involved in cell wall biosynthesis